MIRALLTPAFLRDIFDEPADQRLRPIVERARAEAIACDRPPCRSPIACNAFGYCRLRNLVAEKDPT